MRPTRWHNWADAITAAQRAAATTGTRWRVTRDPHWLWVATPIDGPTASG